MRISNNFLFEYISYEIVTEVISNSPVLMTVLDDWKNNIL